MNISAYDVMGFTVAFDLFIKSGLFTAVQRNPGKQTDLYAESCAVSKQASVHLFKIMTAAGILYQEEDGGYGLSEFWQQLHERLPGGMIGDYSFWKEMQDFVWHGSRPRQQTADNQAEIYSKKAFTVQKLYRPMAEELAQKLDLRQKTLDIGAGSGVWSIPMPGESVTFLDQKPVVEELRKWILENDYLGLKIWKFVADDYRKPDGWGKLKFDRIVIANVLHLEHDPSPLIKKWMQCLNDDGMVVVIDSFGGNNLSRRLYDMHLAMRTLTGRNHSLDDIIAWFKEAGFDIEGLLSFSQSHPQSLAAAVFVRK